MLDLMRAAIVVTAIWLGAAGAAQESAALSAGGAVRVLQLHGETHHVQGIDFDAQHLWVTSVDANSRKGYLYDFSMQDGSLLRSVEVQAGDRFHPGGISVSGNSIWMPVAEY